jgi:hypothetical protein
MTKKQNRMRHVVRNNLGNMVDSFLTKTGRSVKKNIVSKIALYRPSIRNLLQGLTSDSLEDRLVVFASLEASGYELPQFAGEQLELALSDEVSRKAVSESAVRVLKTWPDSTLLIYVRILGLIDDHKFEEAHHLVSEALIRQCAKLNRDKHLLRNTRKQVKLLSGLWKIVDSAARDQMKWAVGDAVGPEAYHHLDFVETFQTMQTRLQPLDYEITLAFAEPLLQGRQHAKYLVQCVIAFDQASSIFQKFRVIRAMWRQGFRRVPDYSAGYEQACKCYKSMTSDIDRLIALSSMYASRDAMRLLRSAYSICNQLEMPEAAASIRNAMLKSVKTSGGRGLVWIVANALASEREADAELQHIVKNAGPITIADQREFFQWAARCGEYELAHLAFAKIPVSGRSDQSLLPYVNILQRCQRFAEAEALTRAIHAKMLSNPCTLDHFVSYGLIRRAGELHFAAQTAQYYLSVPQPQNPIGVIFTTPRTIEQMRRTPIVVLMEWKKMGWAVIPLFEGVLPIQTTGNNTIDKFAACIRASNDIRTDMLDQIDGNGDPILDVSTETLQWQGIDLSHAAWEEAAINRRVYTPNWSCPALKRSLENLARWSCNLGNVIDLARHEFADLKIRTGIHVFFNFRLPDAVVRFYCEKYGDPKSFFCIHASNGYENYFSNFERNQSSYFSIRNMTAKSPSRTSAFPTSSMVDDEMSSHDNGFTEFAQQNFERLRHSRSIESLSESEQQARRVIAEWKSKGGKVAVAFGKVVCDSGVPYDGGPCHTSMRDWIDHTIDSVRNSDTLLLIKPHPHELREEIASFLNQTFRDVITVELPTNVIYLGHDWFEISELDGVVDLALIYNSTVAIEMASMSIPTVLCSHFGPIDYPVGHTLPESREEYRKLVRFERNIEPPKDGAERAASWLNIMRFGDVSVQYRYHSRQITNCVVYPPKWFDEEIASYLRDGDLNVRKLAELGVAY